MRNLLSTWVPILACAAGLTVFCAEALAQNACVPVEPQPLGSEFRINGTAGTNHHDSAVVAEKAGGFLAAWITEDGLPLLHGRHFSVQGIATSADINLMHADSFRAYQIYARPALVSRPNHGFQALWPGYFWTQTGGQGWVSHDGMVTRQYQGDGAPATEYQPAAVNFIGDQGYAGMAETGFDGVVAVWSGNGTGDTNGVFQRQFHSTGEPWGDETLVNGTTADGQFQPRVASRPGSNYVVVWRGNGPGDNQGIFMRAFDASGVAQGGEVRVNTTTMGTQDTPDIAMAPGGRFVVVWHGWALDGNSIIYAQRFNQNSVPMGDEIEVSSAATDSQVNPVVAMMPDGGFVVASHGSGPGDDAGIFLRRFDEFGNGHATLLRVNATLAGAQRKAGIAVAPGGETMVTWEGNGSAGDFQVYGQVYGRPNRVFRGGFERLDGQVGS